jgi:hypothetical protein
MLFRSPDLESNRVGRIPVPVSYTEETHRSFKNQIAGAGTGGPREATTAGVY